MEARMDDEIMSMMRALLEAQERGLAYAHGMDPSDGNYAHGNQSGYGAGHNAWEPTSHHGFDSSSDYQGGLYDQANHSGYDEGYQSWQPTSYHGFEPSSDYQGGLYAPEHQSGYEEAYQSWDMQHDNGATYSSPISFQEDTYNMMKLLLEAQTKSNELLNSFDFGQPSHTPSTAATEHVGPFNTTLTTWNEANDEDCISLHETRPREIPPFDMGDSFEANAQLKDEFLQEAEWTVTEFEFLLGCTVDENLVLSYEDQVARVVCDDACHGGLVVECTKDACESSIVIHAPLAMEVIHMQPVYKLENKERNTDDTPTAGLDIGSPMVQPFARHLGSLPHHNRRIDHPWKLPFEEVRMKEFGGRFYDEYDPGDHRFRRVHLDTSS